MSEESNSFSSIFSHETNAKLEAHCREQAVDITRFVEAAVLKKLAEDRVFPTAAAAKIRAIVVDVDGTLTDGGMYYSADGELMKKFDTRDAHGLKMLERNGIKIGVITAEDSAVVSARMKKLAFEHYHRGIKDKWPTLQEFCATASVQPHEVLYVGDDEGDLDVMGRVGLAACPADAQDIVKKISHYIASRPGGAGAVREICNLLFAAKGFSQ